jgi:hypothetical protein
MRQVGRTLTIADDETCRVLSCDRDPKWRGPVRECVREAGIRIVQTPYQAPNANAYAERFVRSIQEECLDRIMPLVKRHFRRAVPDFVEHYDLERNHQGREYATRRRASALDGFESSPTAPGRIIELLRTRGMTARRRRPSKGTLRGDCWLGKSCLGSALSCSISSSAAPGRCGSALEGPCGALPL